MIHYKHGHEGEHIGVVYYGSHHSRAQLFQDILAEYRPTSYKIIVFKSSIVDIISAGHNIIYLLFN